MKLLLKQTKGNLFRDKSHLMVLILMSLLTSFIYFFVMFSIDANLPELRKVANLTKNQELFKTALESNTILAGNFLLALLLLTSFLFYMFWRQYFTRQMWELGFYKANGTSNGRISLVYLFTSGLISLIGGVIGLAAGYFLSNVLLNAYTLSYEVLPQKGISGTSLLIGFLFPLAVTCGTVFVACRFFRKKDASSLLMQLEEKESSRLVLKSSEFLAKHLPFRNKEGARIALRRPVSLALLLAAVITLSVMFVLSFSLNKSSSVVLDNQTAGRFYEYETGYASLQAEPTDGTAFLRYDAKMQKAESPVLNVSVIGMKENDLITLLDRSTQVVPMPLGSQVVVGVHYADVYSYRVGDSVSIFIDEAEKQFEIVGIANNAESNSVYISKVTLEQWKELPPGSFNGSFSDHKPLQNEQVAVISSEDRAKQLERDAVSNKISGVINQAVGCAVGILLIYLALLLSFQNTTSDIITLRMLGYSHKEISKKLINVYSTFIGFFFLISLLPAYIIVKEILRSLSIQTKDYMPFRLSVAPVFVLALVLTVIYVVTTSLFGNKIKRYLKTQPSF